MKKNNKILEKSNNNINQKNDKIKGIFIRINIILSIVLIFMGMFILYNKFFKSKLLIDIKGPSKISSTIFEEYKDDGITVKYGSKIRGYKEVKYDVENNVDINKIGEYKVIYKIKYKNNNKTITRKVKIIDDKAPSIETKDSIDMMSCYKGDIGIEYTANDNVDGDITANVTRVNEQDKIILTVKDSSNNEAKKEIKINHIAETEPTIGINGSQIIYLMVGRQYTEYGAYAKDSCGNDINELIHVNNNIDINTPGSYSVTYTVTTSSNIEATASRNVVVYNPSYNTNNSGNENKTIYLTFDDGPGVYTSSILDTLKSYNVKATFFVTNQFPGYQHMINREYNEGHAVGIHTYSHSWNIYSSVDAFMNDLSAMNQIIYNQTGTYSKIMRFAGGSSNTISRGYSLGVMSALVNRVSNEGYVYFDWNIGSGDTNNNSPAGIYYQVVNSLGNGANVILMHDIKYNTMVALPDIINYALANGYTFKSLNVNSPTMHHSVNN